MSTRGVNSMKKIAFFVQWMLCGGVENSLISLAQELVKKGNDVTIYAIVKKGEFVKKIPEQVLFLEIPMNDQLRRNIPVGGTKVTVREHIENKQYISAVKFIIKHTFTRTGFAELNVDLDKIPYLTEQYDIAVNYHMHSPFLVWYLSERVKAQKKYTWIHNDFETTNYDIRLLRDYLDCVDQFFAVAQKLRKEFVEIFPQFEKKVHVALNIVPEDEIISKAEEFYPPEFQGIKELRILTVGRLEEQKGYDIALDVCEKLKKRGFVFQWFVLGNGTQRYFLETELLKRDISDCFHILGTRMNPYPYFKNCDIYVQTSRHEGYVTTVTEAKLFKKPIVTTDVSGAREQLIDGISGSIAAINVDNVCEKLEEMIRSESLRKKYTQQLECNGSNKNTIWLSYFS